MCRNNSYHAARHSKSSPKERDDRKVGRPDVVILADNMKSGNASGGDRASNFPQAAAAGAVVAACCKHASTSFSLEEEDILTLSVEFFYLPLSVM